MLKGSPERTLGWTFPWDHRFKDGTRRPQRKQRDAEEDRLG